MKKFLWVLFSISLVFFLIMSSIRVCFSPLYLDWEYNRANFPPDQYGFTTADRLHWGKISMEYIVSGVDLSYLANQELPDGTPLYIERELSHMLDVQNVYQGMLTAWNLLAVGIIVLGIFSWKKKYLKDYFEAVTRGGWITLGTIAAILIGVVVSFNGLFTAFHKIFFSGDSWLFRWSDSLIRLFPLEFWRDAFILMGIFTVIGALAAVFGGRWVAKRLA